MADDKIDILVDVVSIEKQISFTEDRVNDLLKLIEQVNKTGISLQGSKNFSESTKLRKELTELIKQTELSAKAAVLEEKARLQAAKAMGVEAKASEASAKAKAAEAKVTTELNKASTEAAKSQTELAKQSTEAARAATEQSKANTELARQNTEIAKQSTEAAKVKTEDAKATKELSAAKLNDAKVSTELTKQQIAQTRESERQAAAKQKLADAAAKSAAKAQEEQRPYKQLALAFAAAAKEAQDLAAKYGVMDKRAQAAAKRANELNNELKKIDASIGNHQRNVGNYSSAFDKLGKSVTGLATNFLGLIGVASVGSLFKTSIDEFLEMDKNVRQLQNTLKNLGVPEAFDRLSVSADRLQKEFSYIDNDDVIKSFQQIITYGKLTEKQINDLLPVIINYAADSGKSITDATEDVIKAIDGQGRAFKLYNLEVKTTNTATENLAAVMGTLAPKVEGAGKAFADSAAGGIASANQEFKDMKEEIGQELIPALTVLLGFFLDIGKTAKTLYNNIKDLFALRNVGATNEYVRNIKLAQDLVGKYITTLKDLSPEDAVKDISKNIDLVNQAIDKIANKEGQAFENFRTFLNEKLRLLNIEKAAREAPDKVLGTGETEAEEAARLAKEKEAAEKRKAAREKAEREAAELAERIRKANFEAAKAAQLENIKLQEEIFKDESKSFDERIAALREFVQEKARLIELERTFEKGAKGLTKEEIVAIETQKQTELNQLVRDGHKEYNAILKKEQEQEEKQHKETADRIKAIHDKLQKDIEEGLKEANERLKKAVEEREEIEREAAALRSELANEGIGLAFDLLTAQYEHEKNLIQEQIDLLERKKQKEIEVVNAGIGSAQEKADRISIINDRAAAEEAILEQKKRAINVKEAQFEKAESIANIIAKTAEAIVATLAKTPPPAGIPLSLLIGAIGAAQLARVIATPIPKYAEGTDYHKGGLAVVGDAGKAEGIRLPDGTILKSPGVSTIMDLPKGTKVYPDFNKMMLKATLTDVPMFKEVTRSDKAANEIKIMKSEVVKAIKKIPQPITVAENIISRKIRGNGNSTTIITRSI